MIVEINERFIETNENLKKLIDDFLEYKQRFYIHSPMGTGKTKIVTEILQKNKKVLMVTNRVSLAQEFKERYKDFNIQYYKENFNENSSLIIQYDSLNKIDINNYDIFILDELMSLLMHSLSLLTTKALFNLTKLFLILETKKIVVLDAFLGAIDLNDSIKLINSYREENNFIFYKNRNFLIKELLESKSKISVSCSSLLTAKAIFGALKDKRKPFLYSSETPDKCKTKALNSVKEDYNKYDVFIYTPSITTGVNILSDFTEHFHIDDSGSCDIISSLQMLKRNRVASRIHCFVKNSIKFNETEHEKLNEAISKELAECKIKNPFLVEMDYKSGNYILSRVGRFYNKILALKNSLENNRRKMFLELIKMQFKEVVFVENSYKEDLLKNHLREVLDSKNDNIKEATTKEVNSMTLRDLDDKAFQRRIKLENYILDFFGNKIEQKELQFFLENPKEFEYSRNRELFKSPLKRIKEFKRRQIDSFDFNTEEIDLLISYKKNNFILRELFFKRDLSSRDIKFLKSLGYKSKNGKMILR